MTRLVGNHNHNSISLLRHILLSKYEQIITWGRATKMAWGSWGKPGNLLNHLCRVIESGGGRSGFPSPALDAAHLRAWPWVIHARSKMPPAKLPTSVQVAHSEYFMAPTSGLSLLWIEKKFAYGTTSFLCVSRLFDVWMKRPKFTKLGMIIMILNVLFNVPQSGIRTGWRTTLRV
jgi:hypothetical protein